MSAPWWQTLYDDLLADMLLERGDSNEVPRTLAFLTQKLGLRDGSRVFDQCCGIGSLALPLARSGCDVCGVDLIRSYVARARADAERAGLVLDLAIGDAFDFVPAAPCDAAFNWWTSFGYAEDDATNAKMLICAHDAIRPGGRFALDFMNVPGVLHRFAETVVSDRTTRRGPTRLTRTSQYDPGPGLIHKVWHYEFAGGEPVVHRSTVRAYTPPELTTLARAAGLVEIELYGDLDGSALTLHSPRCILTARRPAS